MAGADATTGAGIYAALPGEARVGASPKETEGLLGPLPGAA